MAEPEMKTAHLEMTIAGAPLAIDLTVPNAATRPVELLPVLHALADVVVETVAESVAAQGQTISCKAGCGACCRQVVPISEVEARGIRDLVESLPEPRRSEIRRRFAEARRRLEAAEMLEPLRHPEQIAREERVSFGLSYFQLQIPCPFLENESCSIHPVRPIACREYLVTSPAEQCADPKPETIRRIKMPRSLRRLACFSRVEPTAGSLPWVPLILAPEWADAHPDTSPSRPATEWVNEALGRLARPAPDAGPADPTTRAD
jgi:Fe-S-cluster containining protein